MQLDLLVLAFLTGLIVKITDDIEDKKKGKNQIKWVLALLYGLSIGYIISNADFGMIFLGAIFAQVIGRKIDTATHRFGFLVAMLSILIFGIPQLDIYLFGVFLIFASLDELDKLIFWKKPKWVEDFRPFLELSAIPIALMGMPQYLIGILSFDLGYILSDFIEKSKI